MAIISTFPGKAKPKLQSKTATPSTSQQIVTPDAAYEGLDKVTINAMKLQSKSVSPSTSAKTVYPDSSYDGLSSVAIGAIKLESKTLTPSSIQQDVTPGSNYDGLSRVVVQGDSDLVAANIKSGVNIFGITGSYAGNGTFGTATSTSNKLTIPVPSDWNAVMFVARGFNQLLPDTLTATAVAGYLKRDNSEYGVVGIGGSSWHTYTGDKVTVESSSNNLEISASNGKFAFATSSDKVTYYYIVY